MNTSMNATYRFGGTDVVDMVPSARLRGTPVPACATWHAITGSVRLERGTATTGGFSTKRPARLLGASP